MASSGADCAHVKAARRSRRGVATARGISPCVPKRWKLEAGLAETGVVPVARAPSHLTFVYVDAPAASMTGTTTQETAVKPAAVAGTLDHVWWWLLLYHMNCHVTCRVLTLMSARLQICWSHLAAHARARPHSHLYPISHRFHLRRPLRPRYLASAQLISAPSQHHWPLAAPRHLSGTKIPGTPCVERERHISGIVPSFQTNLTFTVPMSPSKRKLDVPPLPLSSASDYVKSDSQLSDPGLSLNAAAFRVLSPQSQPTTPSSLSFHRQRSVTSRPSSSAASTPPPMLVSPTPPSPLPQDPSSRRIVPLRDSPVIVRNPDVPLAKFSDGPLSRRASSRSREHSHPPHHALGLQAPVPINGATTNGAVLLRNSTPTLVLVTSPQSLTPVAPGHPVYSNSAALNVSTSNATGPALALSGSGG